MSPFTETLQFFFRAICKSEWVFSAARQKILKARWQKCRKESKKNVVAATFQRATFASSERQQKINKKHASGENSEKIKMSQPLHGHTLYISTALVSLARLQLDFCHRLRECDRDKLCSLSQLPVDRRPSTVGRGWTATGNSLVSI